MRSGGTWMIEIIRNTVVSVATIKSGPSTDHYSSPLIQASVVSQADLAKHTFMYKYAHAIL